MKGIDEYTSILYFQRQKLKKKINLKAKKAVLSRFRGF